MVEIASGATENGIVIGNAYDKYGSTNPIVRILMNGFGAALSGFVNRVNPRAIHEVGCGEGYWVLKWRHQGFEARGTDFSQNIIDLARANAMQQGVSSDVFQVRSIYDVEAELDSADLVVCCEVLEHLENPRQGLEALTRIVSDHLILSVPREPIWRVLNILRGKYLGELGNTPGHLQHWSAGRLVALVSEYFDVVDIRQPLPWTIVLCRRRDSPKVLQNHG